MFFFFFFLASQPWKGHGSEGNGKIGTGEGGNGRIMGRGEFQIPLWNRWIGNWGEKLIWRFRILRGFPDGSLGKFRELGWEGGNAGIVNELCSRGKFPKNYSDEKNKLNSWTRGKIPSGSEEKSQPGSKKKSSLDPRKNPGCIQGQILADWDESMNKTVFAQLLFSWESPEGFFRGREVWGNQEIPSWNKSGICQSFPALWMSVLLGMRSTRFSGKIQASPGSAEGIFQGFLGFSSRMQNILVLSSHPMPSSSEESELEKSIHGKRMDSV